MTDAVYCLDPYWIEMAAKLSQEIAPSRIDRTQTDTGGLVEYTKALERTMLKELGKLPPVTSGEGGPVIGQPFSGGTDQGVATVY